MHPNEARKKFLEYRNARREAFNKTDEQIMKGYRLLAQGKRLVDVEHVIPSAGVDKQWRPRLAIVRADAPWCYLRVDRNGNTVFSMDDHWKHQYKYKRRYIALARNCFPPATYAKWNASATQSATQWDGIRAKTPAIPPHLRPADKLENYHILWEADWEKYPVDPFLVKRVGGSVFAVVAQWDLTDLERAVLAGSI
jgi:hypothetical protein